MRGLGAPRLGYHRWVFRFTSLGHPLQLRPESGEPRSAVALRPVRRRLALACLVLAWLGSVQAVLPALADEPVVQKDSPSRAPETADVEWQVSERGGGRRGGEIAVSLTAEPRTYLPLLAIDAATRAVVDRLHAGLVRRDGETLEVQPALARAWMLSPDHKSLTLELRRGVRFSDGEPFDADDVIFSIQAAQDPAVGSFQRDFFEIDGEPVQLEKLGSHRVRLTFPFPHPSPLWLISDLAMLPEHLLGAAYREGRLQDSWALGTAPSEIAGAGPFRLVEHLPGRSLTMVRNPYYWRRDGDGAESIELPYLDRIVVSFVADEMAKILRFRAGESHLIERIPGDQFNELAKGNAQEPVVMRDVGPGLGFSFVILNLNDLNLPEVETRRRWFERTGFRQALSQAVDRRAMAQIVYHGRATPVITDLSPGNRRFWFDDLSAMQRGLGTADLDAAARRLTQAGFRRDEAGGWYDESGERLRLTLVTNTSNSKRSAMATLIQEDFRRLGLDVTFVGLEFGALVERLTQTFDYDLLLLELGGGDPDPSATLELWRVDGGSHFFHLGADRAAFPWEEEVDRLIRLQARQINPVERRRTVRQIQELIATEVPMVFLVAPNVLVGAHARLGNFAPSILDHPTLWNCDELYWMPETESGRRDGSTSPGAR